MADKKQHIDPQLVDKGWASMQETLDREMPQKKRRRILFFYWVGGMASVAAAAMLLWPGGSASPDMPFNSTNQTTSANKPTSELPKQDSPKLPIEQTHSIVEQQPATSGISSPTAENKPAASAYAFKPLPKASTFLSQIQTQTTQPKRILYKPEHSQAITPLEIEIAGLEISDAPAEDLSDLALITPVKKAGSVRFGMYAKGMLETQFRESAVSSGFLMDAGLGKRFGIQTGIGYQYALLPGDNRPIVDISGREYLNITGDSSGLAISYQSGGFGLPSLVVEDGTVLLPVNRQHRFEFPLQAYFKVKSRFKVLGRCSVSIHLLFPEQWQLPFPCTEQGKHLRIKSAVRRRPEPGRIRENKRMGLQVECRAGLSPHGQNRTTGRCTRQVFHWISWAPTAMQRPWFTTIRCSIPKLREG